MSTKLNSESWSLFLKKFANGASNSGASEQQLVKAESKLKVKLPPSYRAFLSASNGWRISSGDRSRMVAHHAKDKSVRRKAFELLKQRLESETDAELRKALETSIEICANKNK